jgi:UDP-N-acetylglucosamine acyltransferase
MIDKTAIISKTAEIEENVSIGPNVFIGENVIIKSGTKILPNAYLEHCEIGHDVKIGPMAVIGTQPQDLGYKGEPTKVIIGDNCWIREFATVHRASGEGTQTVVGKKCLLMAYSHVAHNCVLKDEVIMANAATIGGHVHVGQGAFLGGLSVFHQNIRIGDMAIISGASAARMDILPYVKAEGIPAIPLGINAIGLRRRNVSKEDRDALHVAVRLLTSEHYNTTQALEEIDKTVKMNGYVKNLVEFVKTSKRGVSLRNKGVFYENMKGG